MLTENDRGDIITALERMWPKKFMDRELPDFCDRLESYRVSDILAALDRHKSTSKWRPQVNELLAVLRGKEAESNGDRVMPSFADTVRRQRSDLQDRCDYEVLLRYWWSDWHRYRASAEKRIEAVRNIGASRIARLPEEEREKARAAMDGAIVSIEANLDSYTDRDTTGCRSTLVAAGMDNENAERFAPQIVADAGMFRLVLDEARELAGYKPMIVDPFAAAV